MAVRTSWTAGDVLTAADLTDTFAAKVAYALPKNAQTGTTYTFVLADANKLVTASNAGASTYTIPPQSSVTWTADTVLRVVNYGAGTVTFAGGSGVTVTNTAATLVQYGSCALVRTGSDAWTVVPFSGGASPLTSGNVTGTTGSPTITTSGIYTIYKFTGSGSITINRGGLVQYSGVGGGAGGHVGGGGAGGFVESDGFYLPSGTHTVTVGGGGALGAPGNKSVLHTMTFAGGGNPTYNGTANASFPSQGGCGSGSYVAHLMTGIGIQGNDGGQSNTGAGAGSGGGGAGSAGGTVNVAANAGAGGAGATTSFSGASVTLAGGGGGWGSVAAGAGGSGGGGAGSLGSAAPTAGTANTGGGGGGGSTPLGASGGSGVIYIKVVT